MAEYVLMKRGEATMHVPTSKLAEYLADGWEEVARIPIAAEAHTTPENAAKQPYNAPKSDEWYEEPPKSKKGK